MLDRKILISAQEGDENSMLSLARSCFDEGAYQEAFYWTYLAAKAGFAPAFLPLGKFYASGKGISIDAKKCNYWFKKAAKSGSVKALVYLADNFYDGFGVRTDYEKAVRYYKKATERGDSYAEYRLGVCLCLGVGVRENKEKARYYLSVSSSKGNVYAKRNLKDWSPFPPRIELSADFENDLPKKRLVKAFGRYLINPLTNSFFIL